MINSVIARDRVCRNDFGRAIRCRGNVAECFGRRPTTQILYRSGLKQKILQIFMKNEKRQFVGALRFLQATTCNRKF